MDSKKKSPAGRAALRGRSRTGWSVPRSVRSAYLDLDGLAHDRLAPPLRRALARATAVPLHRLQLLYATSSDGDVELLRYLTNTLDVAARTSAAILGDVR